MFTVYSGPATKMLSLWNGSGNNAPPAGWPDLSFDDSAWGMGTTASVAPGEHPVAGVVPAWTSGTPIADGQQVLMRLRFGLPPNITNATISIQCDDHARAVYVNGALLATTGQGDFETPLNFGVPVDLFNPNSMDNVVAVHAADGGGAFAYITWALYFTTTDDSNTVGPTAPPSTLGGYGAYLGTGVSGSGPAVRVVHNSGHVAWDHDGALFRLRSGGQTVLQTPFPTMTTQPAAILGKDPVTGLPMWTVDTAPPPAPPPPRVSGTYSTPDLSLQDTVGAPEPLPIPPNPERVCGAADNMAAQLCNIYNGIVQIINTARSRIISNFTQTLRTEISAQVISLLTEAEFAQFEIDGVQLAINILAAIVQTLLDWGTRLPIITVPNPGETGVSEFIVLRCAAWQVLWLTGGDYLSTAKSADGKGTRDYWLEYLAPTWSFFAGSTLPGISQDNPPWQLRWLEDIINAVPDVAWTRAAWTGAQRPLITCRTCAGYPS